MRNGGTSQSVALPISSSQLVRSTVLDELAPGITSVIHMGAISSTSEQNVDAIVASNFRYSCRLWHWCAEHTIRSYTHPLPRHTATARADFYDRTDCQYLMRLRPLNAYAWSKHLFDRWVCNRIALAKPIPSRWAGLKFFNVYGPNEYHKGSMRSVAKQVFEQIQRGEPARLFASSRPDYPDGGQKRDFVWVADCVDIVLWFVSSARPNGIYNVGSGRARTFRDSADAVFMAMELSLSAFNLCPCRSN